MALITPSGLPDENTTGLTAEDLIEHYNSITLVNEKIKFKNMFLEGLYLNASRIAMQELTSAANLPDDDWHTIAISDEETGFQSVSGEFVCNFGNVSLGCEVAYTSSTVAKTHGNTTMKLISPSKFGTASPSNGAIGFRIAKNDASATAGAKIQVRLQSSATNLKLITQMIKNISAVGLAGWKLVEPTIVDNDKCPDGSTATFLEAGEELTTPQFGIIPGHVKKNGDTQMLFTIPWAQIPKQGSSMGFDFVNSSILLRDGQGTGVSLPETNFTISAPTIIGELVQFIYTATVGTPFSTLNSGPCFALVSDADMTITIG